MINYVDNIFGGSIPDHWGWLLRNGITTFYDDGNMILNYHVTFGVCFINSMSRGNKRFNKSLLKDIKTLINRHKKVVIASELRNIERFMNKLDFRYNTEYKYYSRGIEWK